MSADHSKRGKRPTLRNYHLSTATAFLLPPDRPGQPRRLPPGMVFMALAPALEALGLVKRKG